MSGTIPKYFINELLSRIDIIDIIEHAVKGLKKAGKDYKACCPFHDEKTPSFTVSQSKQFYYCFGCGVHGTAISFLMDHDGLDYVAAIEELASRAGLEVPREQGHTVKKDNNKELYEIMELANRYFNHQLQESAKAHQAIAYLKKRNISDNLAKEFELGFAPLGWNNLLNALGTSSESKQRLLKTGMIVQKDGGGYYDRFRDRIVFPIRNQCDQLIGFGGRVIDDSMPKYLNSPETPIFHKGHELYGLFNAKHHIRDSSCVYVVEGYMDVLALAQYGVRNVVAVLGSTFTEEHLHKLYRLCSQIVFCFDGDNAGQKAAWRALEITLPLLKEGRQVYFMFMPEGDDPDTYIQKHGREKFEDMNNYMPLSDYLINTFKQNIRPHSREGIGQFIDAMVPLIAKLPVSALRELLIKDIAQLADMDIVTLEKLIAQKHLPDKKTAVQHSIANTNLYKENNNLVTDAICLLLHNPQLGTTIEPRELNDIDMQGIEFLRKLLILIHQQPKISCAGILEQWRDSKYEQRLKELSVKDNLSVELDDAQENFLDVIRKIRFDYKRKLRYEHLGKITNIEELRNLFSAPNETEKLGKN